VAKDKEKIDLEKIVEELKLTDKQQKFAEYGVFVTGLDWVKAVEMAEYSFGKENYDKDYADGNIGSYYLDMQKKRKARELLSNPKILKYIKALRDEMDNQLIVDKLWVINKLKTMAEAGSERTQLEATKLIGQTLQMFQADVQINVADSPAKITQEAFEKRMAEDKAAKNTIPFSKEVING
jgi:phage terminase small subunit